ALFLSVIHALIPNHWIPLVSIGKAEDWERKETVSFTAIVGLAHTASTIIIGIGVGFFSLSLSQHYDFITRVFAPVVLISIGIIYLVLEFTGKGHSHDHPDKKISSTKSKWAVVATLSVAMFFSPCLEIEAYYFTAGTYGWDAIILISLIYLIITVSGMVLLVYLSWKGLERFNLSFLEHHEKLLTGVILIAVGLGAYFIPI
ncbi:MAG: hypothetical protein KGY76_09600, partial [Candidatus Thermoplasmatota archaeon]|nr:hypothetical protein [Candidatus Thermoplasmatota archaeon]